MGNQLCSEAQNYCNPHEDVFAVYEYPTKTCSKTTPPPPEQQIIIPTLSQTVTAVLDYKDSYLIDFTQRQLFVKKKRFGEDIYEGQLSNNGLPHGVGKMYKSDGSIFVGKFVMGRAEGQGLYVLEDGAYFQGQILDNKAQCKQGKYCNRLFRYEGGFKNNVFNGQGKQSSDQHTFIGTYQNGLKICGELKWKKTSNQEYQYSYYGKFDQNGDFTEQGTLKEPTGSYTGTFLRGKKHGQGTYLYKNNNLKYEGHYLFGRKEGQGKISFADKDSLIYQGSWKNGLPQGTGYKYDEIGHKVSTFYKQGINILILIDPQQVR